MNSVGRQSNTRGGFAPRQVLYSTDGLGRDTYINYNNGGFWKDNEKTIMAKERFDISSFNQVKSFRKNVAPVKYHSDGTGRDTYVIHESGGMQKDHKPLRNVHLKDFLRTPESAIFNFRASPLKEGTGMKTMYISQKEFELNNQKKKLEKNLRHRLYYGETHKFLTEKPKQPKNYHLMLRSYESNFPNIEKNTKKEKLTDLKKFTSNINRISNYEIKNNHNNSYNPCHSLPSVEINHNKK